MQIMSTFMGLIKILRKNIRVKSEYIAIYWFFVIISRYFDAQYKFDPLFFT